MHLLNKAVLVVKWTLTRAVMPNIHTSPLKVGLPEVPFKMISGAQYFIAPSPDVLECDRSNGAILDKPKSAIRACPVSETRMLAYKQHQYTSEGELYWKVPLEYPHALCLFGAYKIIHPICRKPA